MIDEFFSKMERKLDQTLEIQTRQEKMIRFMAKTSTGKRVVDIDDIARMEDVCRDHLWKGGKQRYLLPRFGQSAYPDGKTRWPIEEYLEWSARPIEERKAEYREYLHHQTARKVSRMRGEK